MDTITLIVRYLGLPPDPRNTAVTGRLVRIDHNDRPINPPAHSLAEIRIWLHNHGYRPDFAHWSALRIKGMATGSGRLELFTRAAAESLPSIVDSSRTPPPPPPPSQPEAGLSERELCTLAVYGHGARPSEYLRRPAADFTFNVHGPR